MAHNVIAIDIKNKCVEMRNNGKTSKEIFNEYFSKVHSGMGLASFDASLRKWRRKYFADSETLERGTFENFTAHDATVQINGNGEITQAWIKQKAENVNWNELIEQIGDKITPVEYKAPLTASKCMLEVPLFDMHFGIATLSDYIDILNNIISLINFKEWEEINLLVGQDLIHTNDMRGHTAKGTEIERINVPAAWADAWAFWGNIIEAALQHSQKVNLRYSKGNHDECVSWCFIKALEAKFPNVIVDDSLKARKVISWRGCFIGYGHCEYTAKGDELLKQFVFDFSQEFAAAKVREIHTGHLHRESVDAGIFVRRLASAVPVDDWHDNNGYVTAHKRFQIFEWSPNKLKAIYYL